MRYINVYSSLSHQTTEKASIRVTLKRAICGHIEDPVCLSSSPHPAPCGYWFGGLKDVCETSLDPQMVFYLVDFPTPPVMWVNVQVSRKETIIYQWMWLCESSALLPSMLSKAYPDFYPPWSCPNLHTDRCLFIPMTLRNVFLDIYSCSVVSDDYSNVEGCLINANFKNVKIVKP